MSATRSWGSTRARLAAQVVRRPFLVLAALVIAAASIGGMRYVEATIRDAAVRQEIRTASTVATLTVYRAVTEADLVGGSLPEAARQDLDGDVSTLRERGEVVGLEVWSSSGALVYADDGHPAGELVLPDEERRRVASGASFVQRNLDGERGVPLLEVFQPADPDADGTLEGIVEVLLPMSKVDEAVDGSVVRIRIGGVLAVLAAGSIVLTMRRRLRIRMFQAEHDPLTGLGNRTLLARRGALLTNDRVTPSDGGLVALLLIDLDGFKRVNDSLGHTVGDDVLVAVAQRLRGVVRDDDGLVRLGGDEFAIVLSSVTPSAADDLADRLVASLSEPIAIDGLAVRMGASIGVALRETDIDLGELLRRADVAMYQAKRRGGGHLRYSSDTDDNDADHLALLGDVVHAIDHDELVLDYQPKTNPRRELTGVEALVRWNHPTRGLLAPDDFLPLVEETASMKPLTAWVLARATAQAAAWRDAGLLVPIAVNVSPRTLVDPDFTAMVEAALVSNGLDGRGLTIEITETAILAEPARARMVIQELRALGVGVSIDDFGTGFTSLAHLKDLPISEIKIDRTFVRDLVDRGVDHSIVTYTIQLAHDLGIPVVAEGVETSAALDELTVLGCDEFQGFLIAHPLRPDAFEVWLGLFLRDGVVSAGRRQDVSPAR